MSSNDVIKPKDKSKRNDIMIEDSYFDSTFYLTTYQDLGKNGIKTHQDAYKHWLKYGRFEGRKVKTIKTIDQTINQTVTTAIIQQKPTKNTKTTNMLSIGNKVIVKSPLRINFKVAVTIYLFGLKLIDYFDNYVSKLRFSLGEENVDVYIGITPVDDLNTYESIIKSKIPNVRIQLIENRGGDIGGLIQLFKTVNENKSQNYQYCYHLHSKSDKLWRNALCSPLLHINLNNLIKNSTIGMVGAKKYMFNFKYSEKYAYHFKRLVKWYGMKELPQWQFVAGTIFLAKIDIVKFIAECPESDTVYQALNTNDTIDTNWLEIVTALKKNTNGCGNDYAYRSKSLGRKPLLSDYMIEHTYERLLGLITLHLGLKMHSL